MKDLKCNSCGGQLHKIDAEENTYICLHCGSKQILEENITNNNYNVTNNVVNHIYGEVKMNGETGKAFNLQNEMMKIEALIKIKDYEKAFYMLLDLSEDNPHIWEIWWLLSKVSLLASEFFWLEEDVEYDFDRDLYEEHYEKAMVLAPESCKKELEKEYQTLVKNYEKAMGNITDVAHDGLDSIPNNSNHVFRDAIIVIAALILIFVIIQLIVIS